jgi:hypothetical protein
MHDVEKQHYHGHRERVRKRFLLSLDSPDALIEHCIVSMGAEPNEKFRGILDSERMVCCKFRPPRSRERIFNGKIAVFADNLPDGITL